uniref:Uncharacterized protein n=1 Tax=Rhizophora mucronata TaxID=61149 RepID=A0A2P2NHV2_RHIMU
MTPFSGVEIFFLCQRVYRYYLDWISTK